MHFDCRKHDTMEFRVYLSRSMPCYCNKTHYKNYANHNSACSRKMQYFLAGLAAQKVIDTYTHWKILWVAELN